MREGLILLRVGRVMRFGGMKSYIVLLEDLIF